MVTSPHPPRCPLGGTTPPREAKTPKVRAGSANPAHRVASWLRLLMRVGLSQGSGDDRSAFSFLPVLAWALPEKPGRLLGLGDLTTSKQD